MLTTEQLRLQRQGPSVAPRDSVSLLTSTFTSNLNLEVPARGDYVNSWDTPMDASLQTLDSVSGSEYEFATPSGGGTVTLTKAQAANRSICIGNGEALSGDLYLFFPAMGGQRSIRCNIAAQNGHNIYIRGSSDTAGIVISAQNMLPWWPVDILVYPWRVFWAGYATAPPGTIQDWGAGGIPPSWLPADGQTYPVPGGPSAPTGPYALLWGFISGQGSSFATPDYRGVLAVGADNFGTNGSAGRLGPWAGYGAGGYVGENAHTLGYGEMPVHNHSAFDNGHQHFVNVAQSPHAHPDPSHSHNFSGGAHSHGTNLMRFVGSGAGLGIGGGINVTYGNTDAAGAFSGTTAPSLAALQAANANIAVQAQNGTGGPYTNLGYSSIGINNAGSGGGHNNIQLGRTTIKLIRM
jgi:hypothetical protein